MLVGIFSVLSISIVETKTISTNIDTLKYLYLQGNIHMKYIKNYIKTHTISQINNLSLNDNRFNIQLIKYEENNQTKYHIYLKTVDETTVSLYASINK
jgi:hypothetical protein